ncbi:MAG: hypothetical protein RIQ93_2808 [Verrucomicrobiota bacterium]|jgi:hypothetical protein
MKTSSGICAVGRLFAVGLAIAAGLYANPPGLTAPVSLDALGQNLSITPAVDSGYAVFWCEGFFARGRVVWARGIADVQYVDPAVPNVLVRAQVELELPVISAQRRDWVPRGSLYPLDVIEIEFGASEPFEMEGHLVAITHISSKWFGTTETLDEVQAALARGVPPLVAHALNELDYAFSLSGLIR